MSKIRLSAVLLGLAVCAVGAVPAGAQQRVSIYTAHPLQDRMAGVLARYRP